MGVDSKIEWTHHTFNPWWGCARVSPGCENCYAETFAKRTGKAKWGVNEERRLFGDKHWKEPLKWNAAAEKAGERHRVFCASMADVFEDRRDLDEQRQRLWNLIDDTPHLDWLLLTKRPENIARLYPPTWTEKRLPPIRNIWLGCTAEDQKRADERVPRLVEVRAAVRFLSCEPLLGPVELALNGIDWVIVGGESGHGARPFNLAWARSVVTQCRKANVAIHVKQLGAAPFSVADKISHKGNAEKMPDGFYRFLNDRKGGDWNEWPEDLRVREYPAVTP